MKLERINWKKIGIITYSGDAMSDEAKGEYAKAVEKMYFYDFRGERVKAERIRKKLSALRNYKFV